MDLEVSKPRPEKATSSPNHMLLEVPRLVAARPLPSSTIRFRREPATVRSGREFVRLGEPSKNRVCLGDTHRHSELLTSVFIARDVGI